MWFNNSIYPRIFLPFMALTLIATSVAWYAASSLFEGHMIELRERQLGDAVQVLADANLPLTPDVLERMGVLLDSQLVALGADGRVLDDGLKRIDSQLAAELAQVVQSTSGDDGFRTVHLPHLPFSLVVKPLQNSPDERVAALAAVVSLAAIRDASKQVALLLAGGALLVVLILAWVVHRIARGITRPIDNLVTTAHAIAEGDLGARAEVSQPHELAVLAGALGDMAQQLEQHRHNAERDNRLAALGELAARVAHELRNPLTAIKLQLQVLNEQLRDDTQRDRLRLVLVEMRRLELIVSGTLMWAKGTRVEPRPGDLAEVACEVVDLMRPPLTHRGIELTIANNTLPTALLDTDRIKQVLFNLINNAADELSEGGRIAISCAHEPAMHSVCLTVEDSGPGFAEGQDAHTVHSSQKALGLGMGLAISREILAAHHGSVEIARSESLGGARVLLHLPTADRSNAG